MRSNSTRATSLRLRMPSEKLISASTTPCWVDKVSPADIKRTFAPGKTSDSEKCGKLNTVVAGGESVGTPVAEAAVGSMNVVGVLEGSIS